MGIPTPFGRGMPLTETYFMSKFELLTFRRFKAKYSLHLEHEDHFKDSPVVFKCSEPSFHRWLLQQRMIVTRFSDQLSKRLNDFELPLNKWDFFLEHYEREQETIYLINTFPDGYFEAVADDGQVACFLPDTYGKKPYRLSFYRSNGPTYHETYTTREEALSYLARRGYKPLEGALDMLVGTDTWNRGLQVCQWIAEGISPQEGLLRDKHKSEVSRLFI